MKVNPQRGCRTTPPERLVGVNQSQRACERVAKIEDLVEPCLEKIVLPTLGQDVAAAYRRTAVRSRCCSSRPAHARGAACFHHNPPFAAVRGRTLDPILLPRLRNRRQVTRHSKIDHGVRSPWSMGSRVQVITDTLLQLLHVRKAAIRSALPDDLAIVRDHKDAAGSGLQ
jgi:hypothetical protein